MKTAIFIFHFDSVEETKLIAESLSPEIKHKIPKTNVKISHYNNKLSLTIDSKDVSALRAACNSYLRWIKTAIEVKKIV